MVIYHYYLLRTESPYTHISPHPTRIIYYDYLPTTYFRVDDRSRSPPFLLSNQIALDYTHSSTGHVTQPRIATPAATLTHCCIPALLDHCSCVRQGW